MGALVAYADAADALVRGLTHTHTRDRHTLALLSSGELVGGARIEERLSTAFAKEVCASLLAQAATLPGPGCNSESSRLQPREFQAATRCDRTAQVEARDVFELISPLEILKLAKNMSGLGGGLLTPNRAFDAVVVRYVRSLEDVCLRCVAEVRAALARLHALTPGPHLAHPAHLAPPAQLPHLAPLALLLGHRRCAPTSRSCCARCASRASRASPASRPPSRRRPSVCSRPRCVSPCHASP